MRNQSIKHFYDIPEVFTEHQVIKVKKLARKPTPKFKSLNRIDSKIERKHWRSIPKSLTVRVVHYATFK